MDEDLGAGHTVLDGFPALRERGTATPPLLGPCLLWPRSPISATAELLLLNWELFNTSLSTVRGTSINDMTLKTRKRTKK